MSLEELYRKRARDMLAVIDAQYAHPAEAMSATHPRPVALAALHPCSARELEWLAPEIAMIERAAVRTMVALHAAVGVTSPFIPTVLVAIYTARYFLADPAADAAAPRELQVVYGPLQAIPQPYRDLDAPMMMP
jgi:hypothetical protein